MKKKKRNPEEIGLQEQPSREISFKNIFYYFAYSFSLPLNMLLQDCVV